MRFRFPSLSLLVLGAMVNFVMVNSAHAQAAAESVLLNGHVGLAGAKAGTAMGNSLSHATNGIAGQIQNVPKSNVVIHRTPRTAPSSRSSHASASTTAAASAPATSTSGGSMITSIQGGSVTRPPSKSANSTTPQHN
jgi:hypothetical protein